ncbi:MAG: alpha/beta fold hydrolase [Chloroflexi bacterium]|nr:alpha/beta fold hydrolase [Chloroflexota bacterium]
MVLCHPHPLYGGTMDNGVVTGMALALLRRGMASLVFNFRGVGRSQGTYDQGVGELEDALAAVEHLRAQSQVDGDRVGIAGYSFGAGVALAATSRYEGLRAVACVACPPPVLADVAAQRVKQPKLFVVGTMDQVVPLEQFQGLVERFLSPKEVVALPGGDHFLRGYEAVVGEHVAEFFTRSLSRA